MKRTKEKARKSRHARIRKRITGTQERPRLFVFRSLNNLHATIIDDVNKNILLTLSTGSKDMRSKCHYGGNKKAAEILGEEFAKLAVKKGITNISFDRGGYLYHGRVAAFAEAARKSGLKF